MPLRTGYHRLHQTLLPQVKYLSLRLPSDGKAKVSDLPLGKYRVVEVEAPYGYVLNKEEQDVTFVYVDDKTPVSPSSQLQAHQQQEHLHTLQ